MDKLKVGDIVGRKSYNSDVAFKVIRLYTTAENVPMAEIKGMDVRLYADAPLSDLVKITSAEVQQKRHLFVRKHSFHLNQVFGRRKAMAIREEPPVTPKPTEGGTTKHFFELPGRVLHIDGDPEYLKLCLASYRKLNIIAWGYAVPEEKQPLVIEGLLKQHLPNILVLTGHDGLLKGKQDWSDMASYRNSRYFVEAVKKARQFAMDSDTLTVFAGACQSYFEAIIRAGANFASSPKRVLIHAFDPVMVVEKLAYTPFEETIPVNGVIDNTITGIEGIGGIETKGTYRRGLPKTEF